jgi:inorganic triphosphatase YgiF
VTQEPPQTHREVERKLRVHGLYRVPDLAAVEGSGVASVTDRGLLELTATYYDTGDLRLARSKVTLRRREGGEDDGWHLKLPADATDPGVRDELRVPLEAGDKPPAELTGLVLGITRGADVEPVATLRTERVPRDLVSEDGDVIAELVDDEVSVLDGAHVAARFRELEVETRRGTPAQVETVVRALVASGAVEGGLPAKAVRALGPAASAPPDVAESGPVGPGDPAGRALTAHLARHTAAFVAQDLRVRRDLPDAVHQMRVAARRLRSGLKVFGSLVDPQWSAGLRGELAWAAAELGEVRDREVLEERLLRDLEALPAVAPGDTSDGTAGIDRTDRRDVAAAMSVVRRAFDDDRASARAELDAALCSERYLALLDALVQAVRDPQLTETAQLPAGRVLPPLLNHAWHRLVRDAGRLELDDPDEHWHEVRIVGKRARYAAEALVPVFGGRARRAARRLEEVTELLGEHQDAVIAADTTRRLAAGRRVTGTTGFVLGLLHEHERAAVTASRRAFLRLRPDLADHDVLTWSTGG